MNEYKIGQIFEDTYPPEATQFCNSNRAYIEEIDPVDGVRRFQIVAVPEPTEQELLLQSYRTELAEKESWLRDHDYIGVKIATGRATVDDYAAEIATMTEYAARVEELRMLIEGLK